MFHHVTFIPKFKVPPTFTVSQLLFHVRRCNALHLPTLTVGGVIPIKADKQAMIELLESKPPKHPSPWIISGTKGRDGCEIVLEPQT